jgi:C_GCAxxG_C_C family probable redox protein
MDASKAVQKFKEGYNCAQSVLYNYAIRLGISNDMALKMGTGFGGGMGRRQEVCGAISGGILVLNMIYGRGETDDKVKQEFVYQMVRDLTDRFENEAGTIICKELLDGCILNSAEGQKRFHDEKMIDKCYSYVDKVVKILDEIIEDSLLSSL